MGRNVQKKSQFFLLIWTSLANASPCQFHSHHFVILEKHDKIKSEIILIDSSDCAISNFSDLINVDHDIMDCFGRVKEEKPACNTLNGLKIKNTVVDRSDFDFVLTNSHTPTKVENNVDDSFSHVKKIPACNTSIK